MKVCLVIRLLNELARFIKPSYQITLQHMSSLRISERNLGRDNRVIGDHMRDCVAPYLDESFVSFVNSLPIQYKVSICLATMSVVS